MNKLELTVTTWSFLVVPRYLGHRLALGDALDQMICALWSILHFWSICELYLHCENILTSTLRQIWHCWPHWRNLFLKFYICFHAGCIINTSPFSTVNRCYTYACILEDKNGLIQNLFKKLCPKTKKKLLKTLKENIFICSNIFWYILKIQKYPVQNNIWIYYTLFICDGLVSYLLVSHTARSWMKNASF